MNKIKLMIVEDDVEFLKVLELYLSTNNDIVLVANANTKEEAYKKAIKTDIDIILMDINLTDNNLDGIYLAAEILQKKETKIIMLTSLDPKEVAADSFKAGAVKFLRKEDFEKLPDVIRETYAGDPVMEILLRDYKKAKEEEVLKDLTITEREVFQLIEKGYSRKEIQDALVKSESTVKNQISKILLKLGVKSCKEAVKKVRARGLLKSNYINRT